MAGIIIQLPGQGGGGGGTSNYEDLENKPKIGGVTLFGNKTPGQLGLQEMLQSGTNIKTINGISILGSGNIKIGKGIIDDVIINEFDPAQQYSARELVFYEGDLWKFKVDHEPGAWNSEEVDPASDLELISYIAQSTWPLMTAGGLVSKITQAQMSAAKYAIRPTGGDEDIVDGPSLLYSIRGNLDPKTGPFLANTVVSTSENLVDPSQYLTVASKKAYYFPVVKGEIGAFGTTSKNNGYVIVTTGVVNGVYYSATKPTASSYGVDCGFTADPSGVRHYTPSGDGWMTIICDDNTVPACHITWSGKDDDKGGTFGNNTKNIAEAVSWIHPWGMAALFGPEYNSFDEINLATGKLYRRNDRIDLGLQSWAMETGVNDNEETVYTFTTTVSAMKSGGLFNDFSGMVSVNGKTLTVVSSSISSVADLQAALSGDLFYFELATVATTTTSISSGNTVSDMGLQYFLYNGELVATAPYVTEGFYQSGTDSLFNAVTRLSLVESLLAHALSGIDARLVSFMSNVETRLGDLLVEAVKGKPRQIYNVVSLFKLSGSGSPITGGIVPDFIGQEYYDTTNNIKYEAFSISSASGWVALNS